MQEPENNQAEAITEASAITDTVSSGAEAEQIKKSESEVEKDVFETGKESVSKEIQPQDSGKDSENEILKQILEKLDAPAGKDIQEKLTREHFAKAAMEKETFLQAQNAKLRRLVAEDISKIQNFRQQGLINPIQEQNLKNLVLKSAFDKYLQNGAVKKNSAAQGQFQQQNSLETLKTDVLGEFQKEKPDFFASDGRKEVLDYLKSDLANVRKDDLKKISALIESVEKGAIDRYLKKTAYEKNIQKANESAKQKLTAAAQSASFSDGMPHVFTRKQIGKMSGAEFAKNESLIMEQLRKGLIK